ncbi:hypothetical protein L198_05697 [Cryptococcus wingfieldii CBS 7118]|uniref:Cytochrome b5 heme-binding domain-containing protein n=1 Tax=Cryptococcus wingfieldii CBS 7118 TaxID=1295528 RepID=A0A1E3IUA3_9TREE|nr:hypothetical protein L198_05697 [Cryptococcus wingfieldii CBS 7118]ODN92025.1 hypothetical protein L198_05697 [Cryptococcus wingfieldii CBS 7118]
MSSWYDTLTSAPVIIATTLGLSLAAVVATQIKGPQTLAQAQTQVQEVKASVNAADVKGKAAQAGASVMSAPSADLAPPKDDPITLADLAKHDGSDPSKPIYLAIKGKVFDVTAKREMYGPGRGYNVFAGKDGSKGLGMSSLDPGDAVGDFSGLNETQMNTLNQWEAFFTKRYNIVGRVVQ